MKTVKRSKCSVPTSTYCSGSTMKKARIRLRWSLRRVWASVMNSRSARKEKTPNSSVATAGPAIQASQNTAAPIHTARRSRLKRSMRSLGARSARAAVIAVASASAPNSATNSSAICWSTPSSRSALIATPASAR